MIRNLPEHRSVCLRWLIGVLVLAVSVLTAACTSSGDNANVSISLGRATTQALAIDGVVVRHFELEVTCIDGRSDTVRGDVDDDGNFTADVPRC